MHSQQCSTSCNRHQRISPWYRCKWHSDYSKHKANQNWDKCNLRHYNFLPQGLKWDFLGTHSCWAYSPQIWLHICDDEYPHPHPVPYLIYPVFKCFEQGSKNSALFHGQRWPTASQTLWPRVSGFRAPDSAEVLNFVQSWGLWGPDIVGWVKEQNIVNLNNLHCF